MANIIITGANQGIGYYFTEQALRDGNRVAVLDIETDHVKGLAQVYPQQLLCCRADVREDQQIHAAVQEILEAFPSIDIAIHNACLCTFAGEKDTALSVYEQVFQVNYYGGLRLAKSVLPVMQAQKGGGASSVYGGSPKGRIWNRKAHFFQTLSDLPQSQPKNPDTCLLSISRYNGKADVEHDGAV